MTPRRAVVCIGVDRVEGMDELTQAAAGARSFANWARTQGCDVTLWVDDGMQGASDSVSLSDVSKAVEQLVKSQVYSQLIVYFGGHGIYMTAGVEFWLLSRAGEVSSEAVNLLSSAEYARQAGIPHVVFISDACRVLPSAWSLSAVSGSNIFPTRRPSFASDTEVDIFFATKPGDAAYESASPQAASGIFTHCFLELVEAASPDIVEYLTGDRSEVITSKRLKPVLTAEVQRRVQSISGMFRQIPEIRAESELPQYLATAGVTAVSGATQPPNPPSGSGGPPGDGPEPNPQDDRPFGGWVGIGTPPGGSSPPPDQFSGVSPTNSSPLSSRQRIRQELWAGTDDLQLRKIVKRLSSRSDAAQKIHQQLAQIGSDTAELRRAIPDDYPLVLCQGHFLREVHSATFRSAELGTTGPYSRVSYVVLEPIFGNQTDLSGSSAVLSFHDGIGTVVPVSRFTDTIVVVGKHGVSTLLQLSRRDIQNDPTPLGATVGMYNAIAMAEAQEGDFDFVVNHAPGPHSSRVARSMEMTSANTLRAYGLSEKGLFDPRLLFDLPISSFDFTLLTARASGEQFPVRLPSTGPQCPQLTRGWFLLEEDNQVFRPMHSALRSRLLPGLWTTFDSAGLELAIDLTDELTLT